MHDVDDLHDLLRSVAPIPPWEDHLPTIRLAAERRRFRRRAGMVAASGLVVAAALALAMLPSRQPLRTTRPADGHPAAERVVRVPGVDPIRVSNTAKPLPNALMEAIPLAGGAITGATETVRADGTPIALVAVTAGSGTAAVDIRAAGGAKASATVVDGWAFLVVVLPERDTSLVLEVSALDADARTIDTVRVTPSIQDPLSCATNPQHASVEGPGSEAGSGAGGPTRIEYLDAYLGAPLLAVCP